MSNFRKVKWFIQVEDIESHLALDPTRQVELAVGKAWPSLTIRFFVRKCNDELECVVSIALGIDGYIHNCKDQRLKVDSYTGLRLCVKDHRGESTPVVRTPLEPCRL